MNVLFIYSLNAITEANKPLYTQEQIQFGTSYISSFLKKNGHQTRLIVLTRKPSKKNRDILNSYLNEFYPKLICFTAVTTEYQFIANIAEYIKNTYPDIYLVIGGPHASLNPNEVLLDDFDALCIGEGEYPVLELVLQLEKSKRPKGISNLWIKHESEIEKNSPRPFLQDLNSLPFPDREMWQEWIEEKPGSGCTVLLGRGCPFKCTYCCNHAFKKLAPGAYVRFRSPENIVEEIMEIISTQPLKKEIYLEVESFGINEEWAIELCLKLEHLNKKLIKPLCFGANLRISPNSELENLFAACKKANFRFLNIGLESGSERIRREILKRDYSNEDIINAVSLARKYGLKVSFFNMIGIPGETIADFQETLDINRMCLPDWHNTSIFYPYPGTELYTLCNEQGLLDRTHNIDIERAQASLDLPEFSRKKIQKSYIWFDYYVYRGYKPAYKLLIRTFKLKLLSSPYLRNFLSRYSQVGFIKLLRNLAHKY